MQFPLALHELQNTSTRNILMPFRNIMSSKELNNCSPRIGLPAQYINNIRHLIHAPPLKQAGAVSPGHLAVLGQLSIYRNVVSYETDLSTACEVPTKFSQRAENSSSSLGTAEPSHRIC